jgi:Periplasmic binding protein
VRRRARHLVVALVVGASILASCTSDDGDGDGGEEASGGEQGAAAEQPTEVDRSSRFAKEDTFCEPGDEPESPPEDVGPGITADALNITHIRVTLEDLAGLGFAVDVGDQNDIARTYVDLINERCGGIHGRTLELSTVEVPAIPSGGQDTSSVAQAACIEAAEDQDAVFAWSTSGFGNVGIPCLTQAHDVVFMTSYTVSSEDLANGGSRLYSTGLSGEQQLTYMARDLYKSGDLEGKKIGVVRPDLVPDADIVQRGLVDVLEDELGLDVVRVDTIGCGGSNSCTDGVIPSVQGMIADGVEVLLPTLNVLSLPVYLQEMVTQGVQPGDIAIYNSDYAAQSGDLISGKVVEFGGEAAGRLYDGTTIISAAASGSYRLPDFEPQPFAEMCNREYQENGNPDVPYRADEEETATRYGAVAGVCSAVRMIARAVESAGPNPSREDLAAAMEGLGAVDQYSRVPGSFGEGKHTAPNSLYTVKYHFPCPDEESAEPSCVIVEGEGRDQPVEPIRR